MICAWCSYGALQYGTVIGIDLGTTYCEALDFCALPP